jgi:hypothetical protein
MDWTGGSPIYFELDEWSEMELGWDEVLMEIHPDCDDIGYQWYYYSPAQTMMGFEDFEFPPIAPGPFAAPGWMATDNIGGQGWWQVPYGWLGGWDPGIYGEPIISPIQYAVSQPVFWGAGVDESIWWGPMDWSLMPATSIDWETSMVYSSLANACEVNVHSGAWPPTFDLTAYDHYAEIAALGYFPYINAWPYIGSEFSMDSQHTILNDPTQVWLEFKFDTPLIYGVEHFAVDDVIWLAGGLPAPGSTNHGWRHTTYSFTPDMFVNPVTGDTFLNEIGAFTDEMQFRLRFVSDGSTHYRGYMIDNVEIYNGGEIFALDELTQWITSYVTLSLVEITGSTTQHTADGNVWIK